MAVKPMLDDLELELVQQLESDEHQVHEPHPVPALEGDFLQPLGRQAERITLIGILTTTDDDEAESVGEKLKKLREKFRAAEPATFVADIATATRIDTVLIEEMSVRELAGKPQRFEYAFTLREYLPADPPGTEPPPPPPPRPRTTLIVVVVVEGQPNFDFSKVTVTAEGTHDDGTAHNEQELTNRENNVWTEEDFPAGNYTVRAVTSDPPMRGSESAVVREGQTTEVTIILRQGSSTAVAQRFIVHFHFDKAFIQPCQRKVLNRVARYSNEHSDRKVVIVGHTDESGSDTYNLSLGDRRARSVFAYLNLDNDRAGSLSEWHELRQTGGGSPTLRDNWSVRQYQYMLEDLGYLPGNIDGVHGNLTSQAVSDFRAAKGLPPGTHVDDAVWAALIEDYHSQEPQGIPLDRYLRNANPATGCDGGPLKWLSCGEQMPRGDTPRLCGSPAWRPNRRVEILFVTETTLPCRVPEPVTFNLPTPGAVSPTWCLGPGDPGRRCCFRDPERGAWVVQPAESGTVTVTGSIRRPDGTPLPNTRYLLIAPDGEFMGDSSSTRPSQRERVCASPKGLGIPGATRADGTFDYSSRQPTPVGIYTMEVELPDGPHFAHLATRPPNTGRGSIVCARLDGSNSTFDVIVRDGSPTAFRAHPSITPATSIVLVKKPSNDPARREITLRSDQPFEGTGHFEWSSPNVRFFTAATGGTEIAFSSTDFTSAELTAGVHLFAEGAAPSAALDDITLTLTLVSTTSLVGPPATATMTSVELTLDICVSRTAPGTDPAPLSMADKTNPGRTVQVRDVTLSHERAMLIVRPPNPAVPVTLELVPITPEVAAFTDEIPAAGQTGLPNPHPLPPGTIPAAGTRFFAEGVTASATPRSTGFRLGIQGLEPNGDSVAVTTAQLEVVAQANNVAPGLRFVRFGLWDQAYEAAAPHNLKTAADEANHFIGRDARRFHFRLRDANQHGSANVDWNTLRSDRATVDDAHTSPPNSAAITLMSTPPGSRVFVSRAVMLVVDETDVQQGTESGLAAPLDTGVRAVGSSNHRTRRASIDGFVRTEYRPQPGVLLRLLHSVFDRSAPFSTTAAASIAAGTQLVTPAAMSGTTNGVRWSIRSGATLVVGGGASQETVHVTLTTATTFTATFANAHAGPVPIAGTADERRRLHCQVVRYTNPADPGFPVATAANIAGQFQHANDRWNQVGLRVDPAATTDRPIPAAALDAAGLYGGSAAAADQPMERAVLADLIPITPDDSLTVVFVAKSGGNAYSVTFPRPAATQALIANRHFVFINVGLSPNGDTLAHELHHVLFNRGDNGVERQYFTFNTNPSAGYGLPLPNVQVRRRLHNHHTADPNNDPNNDNVVNWMKRVRSARFPIAGDLNPAADATTGNRLTEDF